MKICKTCEIKLPLNLFYRNRSMGDGHLNKCKICCRKESHVENPMGYPRYRRFGMGVIKEAIKMRQRGFSYRVIEAELGIPMANLRNYIKKGSSLKEVASRK